MHLVAFALTLAAAHESNPVPRVVGLLTSLKAQLEKDGADEKTLYDTFSCWCEKTTTEKTEAIADAEKRVAELTDSVQKLRGVTASTAAEVTKLTKDLADAEESLKKAEAQRTKDAAAYTVRKGELETGIANLASAIDVLARGRGESDAEEETKLLAVTAGVRSALHLLPRSQRATARADKVRHFLSNPAAMAQTQARVMRPGEKYNPQSGEITGILKDMHDQFQADLVKANTDEGNAVENFNSLKETQTENINMLDATLTKKTAENGSAGSQLAEDELERKETNEQLAADREVLATTTKTCKTRASEWSERTMLRTEEMFGIDQAVQILNAGAESFANATAESFVQLRTVRRADPTKTAAYRELAALASRSPESSRLAVVATAAEVQQGGHFDGVIAIVDRMLGDLAAETKADEEHKLWCNDERRNAKQKEEAMEYDSGDQQAKIERMEAKKQELEDAINASKTSQEELKDSMNASLTQRVEDNAAYTKLSKETQESVRVLTDAIAALGAFAENHAALLQARADPPPTFTGSYGGRSSESKGILAILEMIKDDMIKQANGGHEEEEFSLAQYRKLRAENEADMEALQREQKSLEGELAHTMQVLTSTTALQTDTNATLDATQDYIVQLKPNCDWVEHTYESRKTARTTEVTGLQNAKAILSGAELPEEGLLATSKSVAPVQLSVAAELNALNAAPRTFLRH